MDPAWREHLEALKRFNAWEDEQRRNKPESYADALAWLSEAWELAARYGPPHDAAQCRDDHAHRLALLRLALERASLQP
jgi:hypothetical protein